MVQARLRSLVDRRKAHRVALLLGTLVVFSMGASAQAETPPPAIPMTVYGDAPGATPGQRVIALVTDGTKMQVCSNDPAYDVVLSSEGKVVYRVSVHSDQQTKGCGAAGRQVVLYFAPGAGVDGRAATTTVGWQQTVVVHNVTLTAALANKGYTPLPTRDGTY
ncbi:MAG: hypothetical protein L6Q80_12405 [Dehalococcoidia bacterium]|nr:MAG: hypothetical protein EDM76_13415 [bacterium]MCK6565530.1 hypothetical protein [Dehalococcoidia bacterium]MCL4230644.1 hypothetical protein [Dehalococcoidia bacterium]RIL02496.1 MAG: hypothetical protein DCC78_07450 [bacterium]